MLKSGYRLAALTVASRVLGLIREATKAAFLGTGALAEAFTVAFIVPNFLRRLFAEGSIAVAFIPVFSDCPKDAENPETREFLSAVITILTLLVAATVAVGIALAPQIALIFASERQETSLLIQMMFPYLGLVSVAAFFQGILNTRGLFVPTAMGPIFFNLCFIAVPFALSAVLPNPARAMAVGVILGGFAQALCQLPAVLKLGYRFGFISLRRAIKNAGMRRVLALIAPTVLGMAAYQINDLVCTSLASAVQSAASIQYSIRVQELFLGVFAVSAGTVLLPRLAHAASEKNWVNYSGNLGAVLKIIALLTLPVSLLCMLISTDIVTLIFKSNAFNDESVRQTSAVFFFHMMGMTFIAWNRILAPAFYALKDAKTPTIAGFVSFAANIACALLLVGPMQGRGIALALSAASLINTVIMVAVLVKKDIPGVGAAIWGGIRYACVLIGISVVALVPVYFAHNWLSTMLSHSTNRFVYSGLPFLASCVIFAAVGLGALALFKDPTLRQLVRRGR